ncbi:MAG: hypothetical protein OIF51_19185 [Cellvibrionaceae bacterium]|nr:hypothetical protein [Cellvibrionaceae bacterium]
MKIHIDTEVDDVVILQKKTTFQFILNEALIYLSQIMVFFWVTFLVSGSLTNEENLIKFLGSKIHDNSLSEVGHVILGTVITFGIILMIIKVSPTSRWLEELSDEILASISRTIYFFGSSVTGSILVVALYSNLNPTKDNPAPEFWLGLSAIFGFGAFIYGCGTSYAFKYKKYIAKSRPNKSKQADADKTGTAV